MQEEDKAKRKAEITSEYEALKQKHDAEREHARDADDSEDEAEDVEAIEAEEDYRQQIEEIDNEEFEDDEEEEEEETESEATERKKSQITEEYEEQTQSIEGVQVSHTITLLSLTWYIYKYCLIGSFDTIAYTQLYSQWRKKTSCCKIFIKESVKALH